MDTLKKHWALAAIAGLLALSIYLYTHPQRAGQPPLSAKQGRRTAAAVAEDKSRAAHNQQAAGWAGAEGQATYRNATTAATHAATLRTKTHRHAPARPAVITPDAVRSADSLLANY